MRQRREEGQARMGRRKGAVGAPSLATRGRDWEMTAAKPREKKRGKGTRGREVVSSQKPQKPWLSVICPIRSMLREQRLIFVLVGVVINSLSNKIDSYVAFKPRLDQSGEEHLLGTTCTELDSEKSWEVSVSLSKLGHHNALEVVVVSQGITYYTAADANATAFRPPPIREIKQGPHHARAIIDQFHFHSHVVLQHRHI